MKHIAFPTEQDAAAFQQDLARQGLARPEYGRASLSPAQPATDQTVTGGGTAEDAGAGAIKGTEAGVVVGAVAGVIGAVATVATGGLALPVILGMAALGSGVGASVGAIGGAAGVDETHGYTSASYDAVNARVQGGEYVIAVDDSVSTTDLQETVTRHGGHLI